MIQKVEEYCRRNKLLDRGDKIVIGLSGGADSVCLFCVLMVLREKYDLELQAVHIHHGIRREEADRDARFVKELCKKYKIPCLVEHYKVLDLAKEFGISAEEAGRQVRYKVMERVRKETGFDKIAVAHHSGDQAETILFHLCRGSGLAGLVGMRARMGVIIRPLLLISRLEIEAFLKKRDQIWCMDSTNLENNYSRNCLRNQIIPLITEQINSEAAEHIAAAGEIFGEAYAYIQKEAKKWIEELKIEEETTEELKTEELKAKKIKIEEPKTNEIKIEKWKIKELKIEELEGENWEFEEGKTKEPKRKEQKEKKRIELKAEKLKALDPLIRKEIYRIVLGEIGGLRDISAVHLKQADNLLFGMVGKRTDLPNGRKVIRTYKSLLFLDQDSIKWEELKSRKENKNRKEKERSKIEWIKTNLEFGKEYILPSGSVLFMGIPEEINQFCQKNGIKREKIMEENLYTKCFDYDKIKGTLTLRTREIGDYLELGAGAGTRMLKKYFIDKKVPREERNKIPLIADGEHILWVIGYRISAGYKVTETTRKILQITISGGQ